MTFPPPPRHDKHHTAMTLGQYWRSDSRRVPGRKPPKWAGRAAFWLGLLAAALYFGGGFLGGAQGVVEQFAAPVGLLAMLFAAIAIIAGIGRGLGIVGLLFALAGSSIFWVWLDRTLG